MVKTLRITFSLRMTTKINAILYVLKHIPLLGRCFPDDVYRVTWLKVLATVFAFFWELGAAFLGKAVYFVIMIALASLPYPMENKGPMFGHFLVFLTLVGGRLNSYLFEGDDAADQAVLLLGMDARMYTLVNYGYALVKVLLGFLLCGTIFGLLMGAPLWLCLLAPLYVIGMKLTVGALLLKRFQKKGELDSNEGFSLAMIVGGLALAYGLPALGICLPVWVSGGIMGVSLLTGALSVKTIMNFSDYRFLRQQLRNQSEEVARELEETTEKASRNQITDRSDIKSERRGFAYLNDLFIKRHRKLFWKPSLIVTAIAAAAVGVVLVVLALIPDFREPINSTVLKFLPVSAFLMYAINRGTSFTQALFVNCDRSLLTYSFYKRRDYILKLFAIRLWGIIRVNLLPALVIAAGLPLILFASGGASTLDYAVVFVTILALSVFFSVHYLTLYYLLQPYTAGTELKSGLYSAITGATYVVCYALLQIEGLPPIGFGIAAIGFSVAYCIVACVLVYFLAPKTFRIRS